MDNKTKNLLVVATEECAEVVQACTKAIRFGLNNHHPNRNTTNADEILTEFYQLEAVIEELQRDGKLPIFRQDYIRSIKSNKIKKIEKYRKQFSEKITSRPTYGIKQIHSKGYFKEG